jgi:hypothetical protein
LRRTTVALAVAVVVAVIGVKAAGAQTAADMNSTLDTLFGSHAPYRQFFETLKKAVTANDKSAVASMVVYPFRIRINGKVVRIKDTDQFQAEYDRIMTPKVKAAVAKQSYPTLFANADGVSIGDGAIWFSGIGTSDMIKITAINN